MVYIGIFILGLIAGSVAAAIISRKKSIGALITTSDEDGTYLFLALSKDPSIISQKKYVTLKVNIKNNPQK